MNDTKKSKRGGARDGAGRKSNKEKLGIDRLLSEAISDDEWITIFRALKGKAKRGDSTAAKLLMAYAFGEPDKSIEINGSKDRPIEILVTYADRDNVTAPTPGATGNQE